MTRYRRLSCWLVLLVGMADPWHGSAEANSTLAALAQGTVIQFSGKEAISRPFEFDVMIATSDKALNLALAVGQPISVTVAPGRTVSGIIERLEQVDGPTSPGFYRLRIVPGLQRLQYRTTSRTFYGKNAIEVATQVLHEAGLTAVEVRVAASLPAEEMMVQYQESDLTFVSRLLEGAGIHYHFEGTPTGEKLVLSDGNAGFPMSAVSRVAFGSSGAPTVLTLSRGQSMHSGQIQAGDYNWKTPGADLSAAAQATAFGDLSERLFPAGVATKADAQAAANIRLTARMAESQACSGESTYSQLQAGTRVLLVGHPRPDFNQEYVITAVDHQRADKDYRNRFHCLPVQITFRPPPVTPPPLVAGVVAGIVIGPPGEAKHVDQFGRVKIRFPWRSSAHSNLTDPGDGGYVRVAQIATGGGVTSMWLPDVGEEVLVAFEYGDPRRPVVVGSVYNGRDLPPVTLPANKHLSLFRHQGPGGAKTEFIYDGTPGNERLLIQSGPNGLTFSNTGITLHGAAVSISSTGDLVERAGRTFSLDAGAALSVKSGQDLSVASQRDADLSIGNHTQLSVGSNLQISVGANATLESGKDLSVRAGHQFLLQAKRTARFTAGEDAVIQTGRSLITNAGALFQFVAAQTGSIQVGDAWLTLRRDGTIDLLGKEIGVKASGNLTLKGSKIIQN